MFVLDKLVSDKEITDTKVMVAMSGGVDSSTVAVYLHKLGYQVIGVTMQLYDNEKNNDIDSCVSNVLDKSSIFQDESKSSKKIKLKKCCAGKDIYDAKRVAESFGFPHYVVDYEDVFKSEVIDPFIQSYLIGETPVPCILCNQTVKFRDLLGIAKKLNVDVLATGHYIRRFENSEGNLELHKAKDLNKDQSYFLFSINSDQLKFLRFPLGNLTKEETRSLARSLNIDISEKPDSQDICFVNSTYSKLIESMRPESISEGNIIDSSGKILGKHNGIVFYTVGQRQGININYPVPLYVLKIDAKNNVLIVGTKDELEQKIFFVKKVNWFLDNDFVFVEAEVKVRSGVELMNAVIYNHDEHMFRVELIHASSKTAIAPGQACVIYQDTRVLGGGWITKNNLC